MSYYLFIHDLSVLLIPIVITLDRFILADAERADNATLDRAAAWMSAALLVAPMCIFLIPEHFYLVALPLCAFMVILIRSFPREQQPLGPGRDCLTDTTSHGGLMRTCFRHRSDSSLVCVNGCIHGWLSLFLGDISKGKHLLFFPGGERLTWRTGHEVPTFKPFVFSRIVKFSQPRAVWSSFLAGDMLQQRPV